MSLLLTKRAGIGRPSVAQQAAKTAPAPKASSTGAVLKDAKTEAFVKWCFTSLQISCDKLTPAVFPDTGRGMAASGVRGVSCGLCSFHSHCQSLHRTLLQPLQTGQRQAPA